MGLKNRSISLWALQVIYNNLYITWIAQNEAVRDAKDVMSARGVRQIIIGPKHSDVP